MKSPPAPALILTVLIGGALLSLGIRAGLDARRNAVALESAAGTNGEPADESDHRPPPSRTGLEPGSAARIDVLVKRLRGALATANMIHRDRALLSLIDDLEPAEFPRVMEGLEQQRMSPNGYNWAAAELLAAWAEVDPGAAVCWEIQWCDKQRLGDNTANPVTALTTWLQEDPEAAEKWCQAHPDEVRPTLLEFVKREMSYRDSKQQAKQLASGDLDKALSALHGRSENERSQLASQALAVVVWKGRPNVDDAKRARKTRVPGLPDRPGRQNG